MLGIPHRYLTADLPGIGGAIKQGLEDFVVEEVPLYGPCGVGEHTYFEVEKRDLSTLEAVERLGQALGVDPRSLGFAGLKDRKAVSRQTLSVQGVSPAQVLALDLPQIRILWASLHRNKLRVGHLKGNRFEVRVRGVAPDALEKVGAIVDRLSRIGLPNYFGPQRFGNRGDAQWVGRDLLRGDDRAAVRRILGRPAATENNPHVVAARFFFLQYRWAEAREEFPSSYREERKLLRYLLEAGENYSGARRRIRTDILRLFYSAYQAYLFNQVVERRLAGAGGDLGRFFEGDVAVLHRNGALFPVVNPEEVTERARQFEISPSGPIFGKKMLAPGGIQARIESEVLAAESVRAEDFDPLAQRFHLQGGRRPLRIPVSDLEYEMEPESTLRLSFFLPKGSYATTFLRELMKNEEVPPGFLEESRSG